MTRIPLRAAHGRPTSTVDTVDIACTLEGGLEAIGTRVADWQAAIGRATARQAIAGGALLSYDHDAELTVELARLAAAEFACCSFFEFTLTVGPTGMTLAVTAPEEAGDIVTTMFGPLASAGAR